MACNIFIEGKHRFLTKTKQQSGVADNRVTKSEFRDLIHIICEEIPGDSTFDFFVDFVENCVEVCVGTIISSTINVKLFIVFILVGCFLSIREHMPRKFVEKQERNGCYK